MKRRDRAFLLQNREIVPPRPAIASPHLALAPTTERCYAASSSKKGRSSHRVIVDPVLVTREHRHRQHPARRQRPRAAAQYRQRRAPRPPCRPEQARDQDQAVQALGGELLPRRQQEAEDAAAGAVVRPDGLAGYGWGVNLAPEAPCGAWLELRRRATRALYALVGTPTSRREALVGQGGRFDLAVRALWARLCA